jgi:hypothetical protein
MTTVNEIDRLELGDRVAAALALPKPGDVIAASMETLAGCWPTQPVTIREMAQLSAAAYGGADAWLVRYRIPENDGFRSYDGWVHVARAELERIGGAR